MTSSASRRPTAPASPATNAPDTTGWRATIHRCLVAAPDASGAVTCAVSKDSRVFIGRCNTPSADIHNLAGVNLTKFFCTPGPVTPRPPRALAGAGEPSLEVLGQPQRQRHDGQRWVGKSTGREYRAAGHEEVRDPMDAAVLGDDPALRVAMHPGRSHVVVGARIQRGVGIERDAPKPAPLDLAGEDRTNPSQALAVELSPSPVDFWLRHVESVTLDSQRDSVLAIGGLLEIDQQLDGVAAASGPPSEPSGPSQKRDRHAGEPIAPPGLIGERQTPHGDAGGRPMEGIEAALIEQATIGRNESARKVARMLHEAAPHEIGLVAEALAPGAAGQ